MSQRLISRSPDLLRLRNEGYDLEVRAGHLLVKHVPYVTPARVVSYGTLVTPLTMSGDVTTTPSDHVVTFAGETPSDKDGQPLVKVINNKVDQRPFDGFVVNFIFSSKPPAGYPDYHAKMTAYINMLLCHAHAVDPDVTATPYPVITEDDETESVFKYMDTASSRAGIAAISKKLEVNRVGIVGLGGTGSYVLDLIAKTPIREIHLFDGDRFLQHNAFRSPSAASVEELQGAPFKVAFLEALYSKMRNSVIGHSYYIDDTNVCELRDMDFVFLSLTNGDAKRLLVTKLEEFGIPFIDVGMGVYEVDGRLAGLLRVTTSTCAQRDHVKTKHRIPFSDGEAHNEYARNIQIADLNALNAAFAVIRWKKLCGFYTDLEQEHYSVYEIDGNNVINEDQP